jgi:DNA modification methylase
MDTSTSDSILHGDCLDIMRAMVPGSVSVVITDPPYGLSDHDPTDVAECLAAWLRGAEYHPRVKGGFMGRSWDAWVPGPEMWREAYRVMRPGAHLLAFAGSRTLDLMSMAIRLAGFEIRDTLQWLYGTGFPKSRGTALKPAFEPIVLARKPLDATVAANVLKHGTGALNIDAARVPYIDAADLASAKAKNPGRTDTATSSVYGADRPQQIVNDAGRFPPNVVLDPEAAAQLDAQSPSSSRFFFCAKASPSERPVLPDGFTHPTVKPLALMRWLVRLAAPPGGLILDPFAGSGTTIEAALLEGHRVLGIEADARSVELCRVRISRFTRLN